MRRAVAAVVAASAALLSVLASPAGGARQGGDVAYRPPVDTAVVERFRRPPTPYGAGNRGIDYATTPGQAVASAAPGEVVFAGRVGAALHVVVLHPDGIRTTYAFLQSLAVRRGERVAGGQEVGTAGHGLHFGARAGDVYVDPEVLLGGDRATVRLVPDHALRRGTEAAERTALERMLRGLGRGVLGAGGEALAWVRDTTAAELGERVDELRGWLHYAAAIGVPLQLRILVATALWQLEGRSCTPPDVDPPRPSGRRLAVLVAGLGSATGAASVLDVDTASLGYAAADVSLFSYRPGGDYGPADTQVGIETSAGRLADHVRRLRASDPGVPVDIIAHSQGGLVAMVALAGGLDGVATLVTLGSPHRGADLATAATMVAHSASGEAALWAAERLGVGAVDPTSPAVVDMAETSEVVRRLADATLPAATLPAATRVVSVAARHDVVVASPRSYLKGAANVVVTVGEGPDVVSDHARLPGSVAARREIALAVAGLAPTCQTVADQLFDVVVGQSTGWAEDTAGAALAVGGQLVDRRLGGARR